MAMTMNSRLAEPRSCFVTWRAFQSLDCAAAVFPIVVHSKLNGLLLLFFGIVNETILRVIMEKVRIQ